jgi:glycerol-3-phosphate O-acyltransferase
VREHDKERVLVEVVHRVFNHYTRDPRTTEQALFDTLYEERIRLETERDRSKAKKQAAFYRKIQHEALRASPTLQADLLKQVVEAFAEEVTGHFDPRVFALATRVVPPALSVLLNALSPLRLLTAIPTGMATLDDQIVIEGETEAFKTAAGMGTTVLVSTHLSNLDSIILGYGLYRLGLPPYTYGAGLNLFSNKMIGFFMHNLGAYKVDRRKKAEVYKHVLKTYAGCTMELGYHNMFFPGGTRSRSGAVEKSLKMGLLGMALDAYIHNLAAKKPRPDIFVVPCTLNYQLVLEAETLIEDYLKEVGKSRYIIEDDEFSKPKRVVDFFTKLFSLDSRIHMVVSKPLDVFGNEVDETGNSRDHRGRIVDRTRYVYQNGAPAFDAQRDQEYTRELARSITAAFHRDTVIKPTHLVAYSILDWLWEKCPGMDFYRVLRTGGQEESIPIPEAYTRVDRFLGKLREFAQNRRVRLDDSLKRKDTGAIVGDALAHLKSYHRRPALVRRGDRLFHVDRNLLLYYHNRLTGFGLPTWEKPQ